MMVTCRKLVEFLDDYVGDRMSPFRRAQFNLHLKLCRPCREYLESYKQARSLSGEALSEENLPAEPMPEAMVQTILHVLQQESAGQTEG